MSDANRTSLSRALMSYTEHEHSIIHSAKDTVELYNHTLDNVSFGKGKCCLCGYYGFGNTGDDVLLKEAIKRARNIYGKNEISALTAHPKKDIYKFGIPCISRNNIFKIYREISCADTLVFGGGSLFQDSTSLRSIIYYSLLAHIAFKNGTRVELWANGLGPTTRKLSKKMLRYVLDRASYIGLRDKQSINLALSLGISSDKLHQQDDLALSLQKCDKKRTFAILEALGISKYDRFAVFGISNTSRKIYESIRKRAIGLTDSSVKCLFVAMYPTEDRSMSLKLCKEVGGIYAERITGSELVGILEEAEICIGSRLHLLIFSSIANTPFEGLGNDPKIRAFCEENGGKYIGI